MLKKIVSLVSEILGNDPSRTKENRSSKTIDLISYLSRDPENWRLNELKLKDTEIGREILSSDPEVYKNVALDLSEFLMVRELAKQEKRRNRTFFTYEFTDARVKGAMMELLRKNLPFSEDDLILLFRWSTTYDINYWRCVPQIIKQVQDFKKRSPWTPQLQKKLENYISVVSSDNYQDAQLRQQLLTLKELAGRGHRNPIVAGEAWADRALDDLSKLNETKRTAWIELLSVCAASKGSTPTAKWQRSCDAALKNLGWKNFKTAVLTWLPLVDKPRTKRIERWSEWSPDPNLMINDTNADILKGIVWTAFKKADEDVLRAVAALALSTYKKVPGVGPRCVRVGNACVWALSQSKLSTAIGHLSILKTRIKTPSVQKLIDSALEKTADRSNLPKDEIEEMGVPTFGLTEVGHLKRNIGDYAAEIVVKATDDVSLKWFDPNGKALKSTPASVKRDFPDDVKGLSQTVKDIRQMLVAQRERIDSLYLDRRKWGVSEWRERYLDHPLVGTIARRLIWKFTDGTNDPVSGIWIDGHLVSAVDERLELSETGISVELWHPLDESTDGVLKWRDLLDRYAIRQPFKQAHREIYLLTDAERNTNVYSNRYAAHILKQHQFNALCAARRWKNSLRLMVDDEYPPAMRALPKWDLRAEFWIEGVGAEYGQDTNEAGTYLYLASDQVRFYPQTARPNAAHAGGGGYGTTGRGEAERIEPLALDLIPKLVFSEIMRDVDLFVGVSSVGNDPNWLDSGANDNHREYWYDYSFGDLSVSAANRKQILEKLLPKLKIAARCSFDDKFLIVKGDIRTYKIHLGSGNILMKPNDQYLCIVASQSSKPSDKVFLPFEGDQRVAIILSKAFLLADDTKITDPTIVRQIRHT
ncbi:MAG: DUF4132 domain-containing protein [Blastocatellia bacterium]|nr:DUF4132 domain-containing protein [Blastocatellia bacterium]